MRLMHVLSFPMVDDQDIVDYGQFLEMLKEDGTGCLTACLSCQA